MAGPAAKRISEGYPPVKRSSMLLATSSQTVVEEFLFAEDIFDFFGKLPIHHRLVPKEIIPIHACHCAEDLS
jgi:hypothetical protein